ncbi:MAG: hypothetical protein M1819_001028 [Sarea resinae]|nr:MAG: hypothetical protein M1819_001028 [Sarea resinae]
MIVFLNELSTAFSEGPAEAKLPAEAIAEYLERYPESNLANILDTKHQSKKLRLVAEDILQSFLDPKVWECDPTRVFLREILAGVVLEMTVQSCSEPEWINGWIVYLLEEGEPELINAIDAGVGGTSGHELENVKRQAAADEESAKLAPEPKEPVIASEKGHQRQPSKIEDPMEEAMLEAKRLSEMIAEEDAKRDRERRKSQAISVDDASESTTQGTSTPTSSQSERNGDHAVRYSPQASSSDLSRSNSSTTHHASASVSLARNTPSFTSFDQLEAQSAPKLSPILSPPASAPASPTLHNANISIIDDSAPGDRATLRAKPVVDYLVQIEPASTQYPGWMIARKYADFETLHEVMRRISVVSGVTGFTEHHSTLPQWRGHTKPILRAELEKYLSDALHYRQLAESEGMRRFLEKDQGLQASPNASAKGFPGIGWPNPAAFETMGKGMLDVLSSAPKGAADGGKALFGGVTGVLGVGSLTQKKQAPSPHPNGSNKTAQASNSSLTSAERRSSVASGYQKGRESMESSRSSFVAKSQLKTAPAMDHRPSSSRGSEAETQPRTSISSRSSVPARSVQTMDLEQELHLPPPPSDIPDDYDGEDDFQKSLSSIDTSASRASFEVPSAAFQCPSRATTISSLRSIPNQSLPEREARAASAAPVAPVVASATPPAPKSPPAPTSPPASPTPELPAAPIKTPLEAAPPPTRKAAKPLTERETQVAVELLFAIINELYTLSSAWNIRRTLLTAAKTFLLRPGNPNLESIRVLLQDSVLDAHTSDDGLAALIRKVRLNALPSEEEQAQFPAPLSDDEKERLRLKARKLLVERALPQALTSVMGAAASGEALGRVFDCLQTRYVARGLMFGLLLQAVRAMTQ